MFSVMYLTIDFDATKNVQITTDLSAPPNDHQAAREWMSATEATASAGIASFRKQGLNTEDWETLLQMFRDSCKSYLGSRRQ